MGKPGMNIMFAPTGLNAECKSVEMHHETLPEAKPGDNVGFNIKGLSIKQISRGNVASDSKKKPAQPVRRFLAQVIVLKHKQIKSGYTPVLDCHTAHIACKFNTVLSKLDARTGKTAASLFVTCATPLLSASSKRYSSRMKLPNQPARRRRVKPNSLRRTTKAGVKSKHR